MVHPGYQATIVTSPIVIVDQRSLINFSYYMRLFKCIKEVLRYHAPTTADVLEKHNHHDPLHRRSSSSGAGGADSAALARVKMELDNLPNSISREKSEAHVKEVAVKDDRMHETREPEPRSLGVLSSMSRDARQDLYRALMNQISARLTRALIIDMPISIRLLMVTTRYRHF